MIKNKIFRNASWIIGCKIVQSVFNLIISMLTARYLGPQVFGLINYAAGVVAFLVPIMQLGLNSILVMELVKSPKDEGEIMGSAITMSFFSALLSIGGVISFATLANGNEPLTVTVCALYSLMLISQGLEMIQFWFQAKYLSKYTAISTLISSLLIFSYKLLLILNTKGIYWFAVSHALDYLLISVMLIIAYKRLGGKPLRFSISRAISLFKQGRYYIVSALMVTVFAQTDKIMLKNMMGDAQTGYYSASVTCAGLTAFVFAAIIDSARPLILESRQRSEGEFETNLTRLYSVIIYLSLLQSVGMTVFSELFIDVLYGADYAPAASALRVIVWYTTFAYIGSVRNIWILAKEKQKYLWIINLSGALANVVLNLILIPLWGIVGAALASLITQIFANIIIGFIIRPIRHNNLLMFKSLNPKILLSLIKKVR